MLKKILILLTLIFLSGCSTKYPHLPTVSKVDINKYKGTWYEIARYEHFFEKGCKNVTATYELKEDDKIKVINRCTLIKNDKKKEAIGVAYSTNESNTKLKVSFFRPFYGDYWILDLAKDYSYAVVGTPNREYFWILSRTKTLDKKVENKILEKLPRLGFDVKELIWTIQE